MNMLQKTVDTYWLLRERNWLATRNMKIVELNCLRPKNSMTNLFIHGCNNHELHQRTIIWNFMKIKNYNNAKTKLKFDDHTKGQHSNIRNCWQLPSLINLSKIILRHWHAHVTTRMKIEYNQHNNASMERKWNQKCEL